MAPSMQHDIRKKRGDLDPSVHYYSKLLESTSSWHVAMSSHPPQATLNNCQNMQNQTDRRQSMAKVFLNLRQSH